MPAPEGVSENFLLVALHRLADRQAENFTTEAFAHVLRQLWRDDRAVAVGLIDWLTKSSCASDMEPHATLRIASQARFRLENTTVAASSQPTIPSFGDEVIQAVGEPDEGLCIPDILISGSGGVPEIFVEVKLGDDLTLPQVSRYRKVLDGRGRKTRKLVAVTGYRVVDENIKAMCDAVYTWADVGQQLREVASGTSATSQYLIGEFVSLLSHLYLLPSRVPHLSKAMDQHRTAAAGDPGRSIMHRSIRSIGTFKEMEHLDPLKDLLMQMRAALKALPETFRLYSGTSFARPWIGWNSPGIKYTFTASLNQPERLTFQRYEEIDPESFDGELGALEFRSGGYRWRKELDLADPEVGFFDKSEAEQSEILSSFVRTAYEYASRLRPAPAKPGRKQKKQKRVGVETSEGSASPVAQRLS